MKKTKQIINLKKLNGLIFEKAQLENLTDEQLATKINSLIPIIKAMRLGVLPDIQTTQSAIIWLNLTEKDLL